MVLRLKVFTGSQEWVQISGVIRDLLMSENDNDVRAGGVRPMGQQGPCSGLTPRPLLAALAKCRCWGRLYYMFFVLGHHDFFAILRPTAFLFARVSTSYVKV